MLTIMLSGPAGSGKTHWAKKIEKMIRSESTCTVRRISSEEPTLDEVIDDAKSYPEGVLIIDG